MKTINWLGIFLLIYLGFVIGMIFSALVIIEDIDISQEVADDVCFQLTGNETAEASVEQGKLVCELPSFDATQNIIIRSNNEK